MYLWFALGFLLGAVAVTALRWPTRWHMLPRRRRDINRKNMNNWMP